MMKKVNRRHLLGALPLAGAALAIPTGSIRAQQDEDIPEDLVVQEIDLLPYPDGILLRTNDLETALPAMYLGQPSRTLMGRAMQDVLDASDVPLVVPAPLQFTPMMAFNFSLPEEGDNFLFEQTGRVDGLVIAPSPSLVHQVRKANAELFSNTSDGKIKKKWDQTLFRFEAHGIITKDLNPTCVEGRVEGIWIKLDLLGWLLSSWNRWKTYAEGSLGRVVNQPGQYQFHWTKPNICGLGGNDYQAVYNGIYQMLRDLVSNIAGAIGRFLDDLLRLSPTIASFLADTLIRWLNTTNPNTGTTGTPGTFDLQVTPSSQTVRRKGSVAFDVRVTPQNGFNGRVSLTAIGRTGSSVRFSPSMVTGSGQSSLSIRTSTSSPLGVRQIVVRAQSGSQKKEVPITLNIQA